ncbi:MAG: AAA family ATPase, partial [Treponema porcinum]|nr:AAA family ATPase [Treponema porcinum]
KARKCAPCIVFIDEFDGIGTRRNYSGSAIETENTRIVTALLNELDGFTQNSGILVLAATNSRSALDEALIRPGRFDVKYTVPFPDITTREKLIKRYSAGKNASSDCSPESLARSFNGFSCAQIESVINRAALIAQQNGQEAYTLADIQAALREI